MATLSVAHTAMRCAREAVGTSASTTEPGARALTRAAMARTSRRPASTSSPRAGRKLRAPTRSCTKATRPRHSGSVSRSCSKARSLRLMPRRRSHSSMPPMSTRPPATASARSLSASRPGGTPAASTGRRKGATTSGSMPTCDACTMTVRFWSLTARKPPGTNSYSRPRPRLQQVRKERAYSKRWKPMRSALSMPRSSSSRTGMVRKISEAGKGVCRKRPTEAVRSLRRMKEGSSSRW
mmetsp:Transcript_27690/g.81374  ORF Transcript_27690/g.81374 Transcript_27690/m.81374 type:complete len:238 (-) Transcript_27690:581-1294(-)